jgi:hypothetical protein
MAVSVPDRLPSVQVAGFRDRLGERVILPQKSGVLLEHLYFVDPLAGAPFFAQALKERVARLATFSHASYCRVRRVQRAEEPDNRASLISVHVPGHRLTEVLNAAAWADIRPSTSAVLAAARQAMASVALLHDFAPDAFHGAIGPDRLILTEEGRIVVAEHVLGTVMTQAAEAWGAGRLWRELGVATMVDPALAHDGRRHDVMQVGLLVLSLLLGRTIAPHEYPDEVLWLLQQATEAEADGTRVALGTGLHAWLESALSLAGPRSHTTLLDSQKALADLMQDARYTPSPGAWSSFLSACETALQNMPAPGSAPLEPAPEPEAISEASSVEQGAAAGVGTGTAGDLLASWNADSEPARPAAPVIRHEDAVVEPPKAPSAPAEVAFFAPPPRARPVAAETVFTTPQPPRPIGVDRFATLTLDPQQGPEAPQIQFEREAPPPEEAPLEQAAEDLPWQAKKWPISPVRFVRPALVLALLIAVAAAATVYAPRVWALVFDEQRTSGQLIVDSEPTGASVTVDGRFLGLTPLTTTLREGSHRLEVQNGGALQSKTVQVEARKRLAERLTFPGSQDRGGLSITTYPAAGRVSVDGVARGTAPVNVAELPPGSHTIVVETPLGSQTQDVTVEAGKLLTVTMQTASWVKVEAPYDLEVSEDGRPLGTTGRATVIVSPGHHHLEFTNISLGLKLRQTVDTEPGKLATVPLDLPMGTLNLTSDQPAEVAVDGQPVGSTPVSGLTVPLGKHEIAFQNPKYGRLVYSVSATLAGPVRLTASFKK